MRSHEIEVVQNSSQPKKGHSRNKLIPQEGVISFQGVAWKDSNPVPHHEEETESPTECRRDTRTRHCAGSNSHENVYRKTQTAAQ